MERSNPNDVFRALDEKAFHFDCRRGIPCFGKCCAKLRLVLTPYDVLRIKNALGISSDLFLERYTETFTDQQSRFPMVRLKMDADQSRTCPFLTGAGCRIYGDRPAACRLYPVGRASMVVDGEHTPREKFFMVDESHCLGFQEQRPWTLDQWLDHEGVNDFNAMNDPWLKIVTSSRSLGTRKYALRKFQMFFMASYNLDRFREFLFKSKFFDVFEVTDEHRDTLARDDVPLMHFAFDWLRFSLFGEKTLKQKVDIGNV